jgi:hypothetical protein
MTYLSVVAVYFQILGCALETTLGNLAVSQRAGTGRIYHVT